MEQKYTGIVLAKYNAGEADRIYSIYTLEAGKIRVKAVGARKVGAKLAGALENFTLADVAVAKARGAGRIISSVIEEYFPRLRKNFEAASGTLENLRLAEEILPLEAKDEKIFGLLKQYLETLENYLKKEEKSGKADSRKIFLVSLGFVFKLCQLSGYMIETVSCGRCGRRLRDGAVFFSEKDGELFCSSCRSGNSQFMPLSANVVKIIRLFEKNSLPSFLKLKVGEHDIKGLRALSSHYLEWIKK